MYLYGFGSFVSETLDEIFGLLYHLLLVLVSAHLLLMAFFAQLHEPAVVDIIIVYAPERDLNSPVADIIDERTVVADHKHRTLTRFEEVFEPLNRLDVQVVRRLVQQQQIRMTQEDFR